MDGPLRLQCRPTRACPNHVRGRFGGNEEGLLRPAELRARGGHRLSAKGLAMRARSVFLGAAVADVGDDDDQ